MISVMAAKQEIPPEESANTKLLDFKYQTCFDYNTHKFNKQRKTQTNSNCVDQKMEIEAAWNQQNQW